MYEFSAFIIFCLEVSKFLVEINSTLFKEQEDGM